MTNVNLTKEFYPPIDCRYILFDRKSPDMFHSTPPPTDCFYALSKVSSRCYSTNSRCFFQAHLFLSGNHTKDVPVLGTTGGRTIFILLMKGFDLKSIEQKADLVFRMEGHLRIVCP